MKLLLLALISVAFAAEVTYDLYAMNNGSPNQVLHYTSTHSGRMEFGGRYDSGGAGMTINFFDAVGGQGGLRVTPNGRYLIAPNSGTNSLTVFARNPGHDENLRRIGTFDLGEPGKIINSIAVTDNHVYALAGDVRASSSSSVVTFTLSHGQLERVDSFALPNSGAHAFAGQDLTLGAPMQIEISPGLLTIVAKSDSDGHSGAVYLLTLDAGLPDRCRTHILDNDSNIPFGFVRVGEHLYITDAGDNELINVELDGLSVVTQSELAFAGSASCWIVQSGNYLYVSNTVSNTISSFSLNEDGSEATLLDAAAADSVAAADMYAVGDLLFVLRPNDVTIESYEVRGDGTLVAADEVADFLKAATLNETPYGLVAVSNYDVPSSDSYFSGLEYADSEFAGEEAANCDDFCYQSQARFTVEQLLANHAHNVDERDYERAVSVFCEDGEFRAAGNDLVLVSGAENLQGLFSLVIGDVAGSRLAQTNFAYINQTPDRITVKDTFTLSQGAIGSFATSLQGAYYDTFVRQDGQWCLRTRWANFDDVENFPSP